MNLLNYIDDFDKHTFKPKSETNTKFKIKDIFKHNWHNFIDDKPTLNIRQVVKDEVEKMISCNSQSNSFDVYTCDNCSNYLYVPFTCKSRFRHFCDTKYTLVGLTLFLQNVLIVFIGILLLPYLIIFCFTLSKIVLI